MVLFYPSITFADLPISSKSGTSASDQRRQFAIASLGPYLSGLILFAFATAIGIWPIKKLIQMAEAKHELKQGSAGYLRTLSGWAFIAFWIMGTWFVATILGDWDLHGDLDGALRRAAARLEILLHIAASLSDN